MKKYCLAALLAAVLSFACGATAMVQAAPAATSAAPEKILQEAWTAYNIGEYKKTLRLIQPLAGDGNPRAQVMLGRCYENGLGVPQDLAVAALVRRMAPGLAPNGSSWPPSRTTAKPRCCWPIVMKWARGCPRTPGPW